MSSCCDCIHLDCINCYCRVKKQALKEDYYERENNKCKYFQSDVDDNRVMQAIEEWGI